ncbi:GNAT family N-acetyltransferase [Paenibacillus sp. HB172176]|uniref:GNAT family N-acetyltransferase n=1 Tax=Paenibacillus sp. HB172176 TaxID=2493690 RepID=UPI001439F371|nr:GNAT family N-acetyltransferase [Paenibacillus sp. HB172176]
MEEVRRLKRNEWGQAISLSDRLFRGEGQSSMKTAFPYSFSKALSQSFGAFEDGRLVSFMGLVPAVIRVGEARLDAFLLGQVGTEEAARGKGFASRVMDAVLEHIDRSGASLMLVSGARSLYERAACLSYGHMRKAELDSNWAKAALGGAKGTLLIRPLSAHDWFGMNRLAAGRFVGFDYSLRDLAELIEAEARASCMRHVHRVLVAEREGMLKGFLIYTLPQGGGSARQPEAIEWAGDAGVVSELLASAIERHSLPKLLVSLPGHETDLIERLGGESMTHGEYPGTIHIVDPQRLLAQLEPYWTRRGCSLPGEEQMRTEKGEARGVRLLAEGETMEWTARQWIDYLFCPSREAGGRREIPGWQPAAALPIPLPSPHGLLYV